jgi:GT2 family glycosyltransferase
MSNKKYGAAVILINYNSNDYTRKCIESIIEKTSSALDYQIVVVDNCSASEDYALLKTFMKQIAAPNIQLVRSNINTGFGAGNMLGVNNSNADFLTFVNNDSLFTNDCLSIITTAMDKNPELGICGPLCYKEDGSLLPTIDHFASPAKEILGRKVLEKINPKLYPNRHKLYDGPQKAQFVSGSFMVVRSEDFYAVGGFDTNIFLYYEETDLCKRLQKINKFAYLVPDAHFIHYHGISTPRSIDIKIELKISFLYIIRKHYGYFWHLLLLNYLRTKYLFSSIIKPKYRPLFGVLLAGAPLSRSMKLKQKINSPTT